MTRRILPSVAGLLLVICADVHADERPLLGDANELHSIAAAVSADRIEADIRTLVNFGTRHTLSDTRSDHRGIGAARRWIEAEFQRTSTACGGCLTVLTQSDVVSGPRIPEPAEVVNVLAIQRGVSDPDRYVVMSGDIDSRVSDPLDGESDSPGANDNASGMAGALESARVLSRYRFAASIIYVGLSGEEQGLYGGEIMARRAREAGWRIEAVLNNDMIGNIEGINGVIDNATARVFSEGTRVVESAEEATRRRFTGGEVDSASRNLARYVDRMADAFIPNLDVMMIYRLDRFGRGGHHRPFNDAGFPAVRIMETNEHYDRQHQDIRVEDGRFYGDTIDFVDFAYAARMTGVNALTLAGLAWAPDAPSNVRIGGAVAPSTRLTWDASAARDLAGYWIVWRDTTSPVWQHRRWVGVATDWTLENVVIDNYLFGVEAVGTSGARSVVAYPSGLLR